jgi:hypothetical protein
MRLGSHMTESSRARLSVAHIGNTNALGHRLPEATKAKISAAVSLTLFGNARSLGYHHPEPAKVRQSMAERGRLNFNWKGGITPQNALTRMGADYIRWRTAVFERDDYTCQDCGQYGGDLEAHHIHEFAKYADERFVVENGKTLCLKCHDKTKLGRPKRRKAGVTT